MIRMPALVICLAMSATTMSATAWALGDPAAMSRAEFDQLMEDISNWGRWGTDDQLGTLNLITEKKRKSAARLVRKGISVSLALDLNTTPDTLNTNPFIHELTTAEFGGHQVAGDRFCYFVLHPGRGL